MRTGRVDAALAALLAAFAASAGAADLGTLFHTPEERERLDRLRRGDAVAAPASGPRSERGAREITGYVKRSDGRSTVWIDGVPVQVPTSRAGPLLEPGVVRGYADRGDEDLQIERKPKR